MSEIVTFDENLDDFSEKEWLKIASENEVFDILDGEVEDIYTLEDGKTIE